MGKTTVDKLLLEIEIKNKKAKKSFAEMDKLYAAMDKSDEQVKNEIKKRDSNLLKHQKGIKKELLNIERATQQDRIQELKNVEKQNIASQKSAAKSRRRSLGMIQEIDSMMGDINKKVNDIQKNSLKKLQAGLMGAGLSFLFTGMAIKRLFQTGLNALLSTFLLVEGENGALQESINELNARWIAFKVNMMDNAGIQGVFDKWIERIEKVLDAFEDLSPGMQAIIVDWMIVGFIIGAVLMVVGQLGLGILGVTALIEAKLLVPLILFFVVLGAIIALIVIWNSDMSLTSKIILTILILLAVIGLFMVIFATGVALTVGIWLLVIGVVGLLIYMFRKQLLLAILKVGQGIQTFIIDVINGAINLVNILIAQLNRIPGINIGYVKNISQDSGIDFSSKIASLQAEIDDKEDKPSMVDLAKSKISGLTGAIGGDGLDINKKIEDLQKDVKPVVDPLPEEKPVNPFIQNINIEGSLISEQNLSDVINKSVEEKIMNGMGSPQI